MFLRIQNVLSEKYKVFCVLNPRLRLWFDCRAIVDGHSLVDCVTDFENVLALLVNDDREIIVGSDELFSCLEAVKPKISDAELGRELSSRFTRSVVV